jgi:phosphatidylglycerophosphate synthase
MGEMRLSRVRVLLLFPPSLLTGARLALTPLFLLLPADDGSRLPLFLLACATDLLDGVLARRLSSSTRIGSLIDAFADFALVSVVSSILAWEGLLSPLFVALIIVAFAQFALTEPRHRSDPLGKHIGTVLFFSLGITLAHPSLWVAGVSSLASSAYIFASLALRWLPRAGNH